MHDHKTHAHPHVPGRAHAHVDAAPDVHSPADASADAPACSHAHGHAGHTHRPSSSRVLFLALASTLVFAAVEAVAGWLSGSLALIGDAGHMFNDAVALGIAALAAWIAQRPPSTRHTYGLGRAEVIAALFNSAAMLVLVVFIAVEAISRLRSNGAQIAGPTVILVASLGLLVNLLVAWLLSRGERSLNVRAALLHVLADLFGSVAALVSGLLIQFTGWQGADPLLAGLIGALILWSSLRLLREALHALMEGAPAGLSVQEIGRTMAAGAGVASVHDLHVWAVRPGQVMLTAHVVVHSMAEWPQVLAAMRHLLAHRFHIEHVTLQPELAAEIQAAPVNFTRSRAASERRLHE
jgi:cobalt-zinc-cadmium efflux system protein